MRTQTVNIAGKTITIQEKKIKYFREEMLPKIKPAWESILATNVNLVADTLLVQVPDLFPELDGIDLDECYPSEIEAFVEAWINVNFTGIKRLAGPVMSLLKMEQLKQGLD